MTNTPEKKCRCHCHGRSLMNGFCQSGRCQCPKICDHCQKEQPEQEKSQCCNAEIAEWGEDGNTMVVAKRSPFSFCSKCRLNIDLPTPPQELRQEEWEEKFMKEFENIITVEHDYLLNISHPAQDSDPRPKIVAFIKNVEQKARELERKRCADIAADMAIESQKSRETGHVVAQLIYHNILNPKSP